MKKFYKILRLKSSDLPRNVPETLLNDQKLDSIINPVYRAVVDKIHPLKSNLKIKNTFTLLEKIKIK